MTRPTIYAPDAIPQTIDMMEHFLDDRMAAGAGFVDGQLIQCVWMWFRVTEHEGELAIFAPELGDSPMVFGPDCSEALNLVFAQRSVCDSFDLEMAECNARQSALVIRDIASCEAVFMNRLSAQDGTHSGWYFGAQDSELAANDASNLERLSLWEMACRYPLAADFYLLPATWQVVFDGYPVVLRDYEPVPAKDGSYYDKRYLGGDR